MLLYSGQFVSEMSKRIPFSLPPFLPPNKLPTPNSAFLPKCFMFLVLRLSVQAKLPVLEFTFLDGWPPAASRDGVGRVESFWECGPQSPALVLTIHNEAPDPKQVGS